MARIEWDKTGEKCYESGVDHAVLYPQSKGTYTGGVPWNGITAVNEQPSGAEANKMFADNIHYGTLLSAEEFKVSIEAYMYPPEFEECDGTAEPVPGVTIGQQSRKPFGLSYRTMIGNDTDGLDHGYKIHLIWGAVAAPSERNRQTVNDSPEAVSFSWECETTPVKVKGFKPTASMVINSTRVDKEKLALLEAALYGTEAAEARLPLPDEVLTMLGAEDAAQVSNS